MSDNYSLSIPNDVALIQSKIYTCREQQVILDRDLAKLYSVEVSQMNRQVKRNIERFPDDFMFQLTKEEWNDLKCHFGISSLSAHGGDRAIPYAFTEQGVAMLSGLLRSTIAIETNILIMRAFVSMRRFVTANAGLFQRVETLENHLRDTDKKIDDVLDRLEDGSYRIKAHIFSAGQMYEAKSFITQLVSEANIRVVLVDGYVSAETLDLMDARKPGVSLSIYTSAVGRSLIALMNQYNEQFPDKTLSISVWAHNQHDRWIVVDDKLWHCGASIKDAGNKTFAIDLIDLNPDVILNQL